MRKESETTFASGTRAPESGIYLAIHYRHRLPHEITALGGEVLPTCARCGERVRFELLHPATHVAADADFKPKAKSAEAARKSGS
jgi:hypothetical protein